MKNCSNVESQILDKIHNSVSEFRIKFLDKYKVSMIEYYAKLAENHTWEGVCNMIDEGWKKARLEKRRNWDCTEEYKSLQRLKAAMSWIKHGNVDKRVNKLVEDANKGLLAKETKLAQRSVAKGFTSAFTLKFSCYDPNLQGVITEGDKILKVWTIVAEGCVQRAHYRYLLK